MDVFSRFLVVCALFVLAQAGLALASDPACPGPRAQKMRPKIVGGWQAELRHWPGQVAFRLHNPQRIESGYFCGGALIADRWVLSAAHCFQAPAQDGKVAYFSPDATGRLGGKLDAWHTFARKPLAFSGAGTLQVVVGTDDLTTVTPSNVRGVKRIVIHPGYGDAVTTGNDLALVELSEPAPGPYARLSLRRNGDPVTPPGAIAMVGGFGAQRWLAPLKLHAGRNGERIGAGSDVLREVDVPLVANAECQIGARKTSGTALVGPAQLCAGHKRGRKDSCQGDSGGPLVVFDRNGCPYQVGIVSWGPECAAAPAYGVYTRVSAYADWIRSYVPNVIGVAANLLTDPNDVQQRLAEAHEALKEIAQLLGKPRGNIDLAIREFGTPDPVLTHTITLGRQFLFEVKSRIGGRLLIVDINARGEVVQLFPNQFVASGQTGRVRLGETIRVPDRGYGFSWFRASEPLGRGTLLVMIVPEAFAKRYPAVAREWHTKGFVPERQRASFFANLIDQIYGLVGTRTSAASDESNAAWDHVVVPYTIVRAD